MSEAHKLNEPTKEGGRLVDAWKAAKQEVARCEERLRSAKHDMAVCEERLAEWISPDDMQVGEKVGVWYGDSLIQVELTAVLPRKYAVTVRIHGRKARV